MGLEYKFWSSKSRMDQWLCMWDKDTDAIGAGVDADSNTNADSAQATLKQPRSKGEQSLSICIQSYDHALSSFFLRANVD